VVVVLVVVGAAVVDVALGVATELADFWITIVVVAGAWAAPPQPPSAIAAATGLVSRLHLRGTRLSLLSVAQAAFSDQ
jgi:hypothetical protein